ncbi:hypothetical protein R1sor_006045 [Riccia sorocarpa]|uniref:Uncharacterized protein n=1 Tax=Riccia sorocarpa TaxID=122646 RepID=A0ABD3HPN2_9MARC
MRETLKSGKIRVGVDVKDEAMLIAMPAAAKIWFDEKKSMGKGCRREFSKAFVKLLYAHVHLPNAVCFKNKGLDPFPGSWSSQTQKLELAETSSRKRARETAPSTVGLDPSGDSERIPKVTTAVAGPSVVVSDHAPPVESDTPKSSTRVPDPKVASGPQSEADLEAIGRGNVVESVAAAKDDTERGLPMNVAIGVPFDVESIREYFPSYNDKQWAGGKINIVTHCTYQFLLDNWENWFRTSIGGRKDGFRAEVRKNFLFFAARVELWKRKTVFRGSLLYPEEPKLRYDERVPGKPRRKRTSKASSTPESNETSHGTKNPTKRKLNLNPPKSRSPSPEVPRHIQPGRKGKRKVDEEATANIERKGKRKADEQPSPEPAKKKERSDDSDEDSDESIRELGEPIQYTRFAELGESEREKRRYGYMDKFISETIRDEIEKHTRPLKEKIENMNEIIEETSRIALEQEQIYKLVNKREINLATLVATKFKEVRLRGHSESIANCDELNFLITRNEKPVYPTDYDDFLETRKFGLKGSVSGIPSR